MGMGDLRARLLDGISRSATVVLSTQISQKLREYLTPSELLAVVLAGHAILCTLPEALEGFNAPWRALRSLAQSLSIQLAVAYLTEGQRPDAGLFNLIFALVVAEGLAGERGRLEEDVRDLATGVSYIASDKVSALLTSLGAPLVGVSLGVFFGGQGLLGKTLALTGVNALTTAAFGAVQATSSLALAWPIVLLYFVHEAVGRFERAEAFLDYGLYKASDAVYAGLSQFVRVDVLALLFFLLLVVSPAKDEIWTGVCALALVRAASEWVLAGMTQAAKSDLILGGLCVVTMVHFATVFLRQ